MRFVFLHGGPGLNSFAEQAILGPLFEDAGHVVDFWNEPSTLRPRGDAFDPAHAFEHWLASAEGFVLRSASRQPVQLIAHSIACHAAMEIARRHPHRLANLVLVAPAADPFAAFRNVLRLAVQDLETAKPEIASVIASCLFRTRALLDAPMCEGMMNVLHDEMLFTHYWVDEGWMQASAAAQARPEAQFDVNAFFAVLTDFSQRSADVLSTGAVTLPTLSLFGAADPVTSFGEQREAIRAAVPEARIEVLDGCSHYLHLERPHQFVDLAIEWATASGRVARDESAGAAGAGL